MCVSDVSSSKEMGCDHTDNACYFFSDGVVNPQSGVSNFVETGDKANWEASMFSRGTVRKRVISYWQICSAATHAPWMKWLGLFPAFFNAGVTRLDFLEVNHPKKRKNRFSYCDMQR